MKKAFSTIITIAITAVIAAILTGVITYKYIVSVKDIEITKIQDDLKILRDRDTEERLEMNKDTDTEDKSLIEYGSNQDGKFSTYTNKKLGFSIKIPKEVNHMYGSCEQKEGSYRAKQASVPVKVFENETDGEVYISNEYYYQLTGETKKEQNGAFTSYYSNCNKVLNNLQLLKDDNYIQQNWKILINDINNDNELDRFIKEHYGSGCSIGSKKTSSQDGVYDIEIKGDGKDLGETKCPINYATVLKYYPEKNKVVSWNLGQACNFYKDTDKKGPYEDVCSDLEMVDSFRFE